MRKILFVFLTLFISILTVKADDTFYLGSKVSNMYVETINGSDMHNGAPFLITRSDGKLVYCINPFYMISTNSIYKSYNYNDSIFKLSNDVLNRINIISYYGYGYTNHTDIKWYGITQFLIYKALNLEEVYFTDSYYGNRVVKYESEVNELENLVNDYYRLPSFANKSYEYSSNTKYELLDTNNILSNYEIKDSNINATISGNKLVINTKSDGNYNITFIRKSPINHDYILYNLNGAQPLIYPGKINDITFNVSIEVNSGSITINKYDKENKERLEAKLEGSVFNVYKNNVLIGNLRTNEKGSISINNLPLGDYIVKEINPSKGYKLDENIYNITITKTNKNNIINSYSKVIEGNLIINKYYGNINNYKIDDSATFEIYHNDKLIKKIFNQEKVRLEYGTYLIKQISGKKYYDLIDDFNITITEEKDYVYDLYTDKTDEIKAYEEMLSKKEESLNEKEKELTNLENKIENEKNSLTDLKNEINKKEDELDNKKEELKQLENDLNKKQDDLTNLENSLNKEKNELDELKKEILNDYSELNDKKEEISKKEKELEKLKEELDSKKQELGNKEIDLQELENQINIKEEELNKKESHLNKYEQELNLLKNELTKKEQELKKEDVLIVEVPDTYKRNYNKLISVILILIGAIIVCYSKKNIIKGEFY